MDPQTSAYYAKQAGRLASIYQQPFPELLNRLDQAFVSARRILDVGCGGGRDCLHLVRRGKDVYGVDGSPEMLEQASAFLKREGVEPEGRLFHDTLPKLSTFADADFDGVLCTAVLMHLPEESVFDAVYTLRRLLRPGGTLAFSVPSQRPGIDPSTRRDRDGRLFSDHPPAKLRLLFERVGFTVRSVEEVPDSLGRPGLSWDFTVLTRLDDSTERPLNLV